MAQGKLVRSMGVSGDDAEADGTAGLITPPFGLPGTSSVDPDDNGVVAQSTHVCDDSDIGVGTGPFKFSPSEHDAFCALWEMIVWDVVPHCHGRIPRPDDIVERFFQERTDAHVFLNRLIAPPFQLLRIAFRHKTEKHEGDTYETASDQRWAKVAMRLRVKRELASPPTPEEGLQAALHERQRRLQSLREQRETIENEYESMMAAFEEKLSENTRLTEAEEAAVTKVEEMLRQISELAAKAHDELNCKSG